VSLFPERILLLLYSKELLEDTTLQIAKMRTVTKLLSLNSPNYAKCLFFNWLS